MTDEHILLLLQIKETVTPTWQYISNNYPDGMLWDPSKVARLLSDLRKAGMLDPDPHVISLMPPGEKVIKAYIEKQDKEEGVSKMNFEKLSLEIEKLRNDFFDYSETKSRAGWSFRVSIIALAIAVIVPLLQFMCKRPN